MLKIVQTNWGVFELAFDANAAFDADIAFATLVYTALFTDAEADDTQVTDRYERRGWWYDPTLGSLIWWYRQNALSDKIRAATIENITNTLSAYPELTNVVVTDITPVGNVSLLLVSISALYNGVSAVLKVAPFVIPAVNSGNGIKAISSLVYSSKVALADNGQTRTFTPMQMSHNGLKLWTISQGNHKFWQFDLETAYDPGSVVNTLSYWSMPYPSSDYPFGFWLDSTGTHLLMCDYIGTLTLTYYTLSTPFDFNTISGRLQFRNLTDLGFTYIAGIWLNQITNKLYVCEASGIKELSFETSWDLSTLAVTGNNTVSCTQFDFDSSGEYIYTTDGAGVIKCYKLAAAYNPASTATLQDEFSFSPEALGLPTNESQFQINGIVAHTAGITLKSGCQGNATHLIHFVYG